MSKIHGVSLYVDQVIQFIVFQDIVKDQAKGEAEGQTNYVFSSTILITQQLLQTFTY